MANEMKVESLFTLETPKITRNLSKLPRISRNRQEPPLSLNIICFIPQQKSTRFPKLYINCSL